MSMTCGRPQGGIRLM